ncbi:MAG: hypothetical protein EZS28_028010 [Streblomastix strix]|uniref:Uncharacterized protein n=1 Tax=Streblomastix strix TaxID=222440 RepID=A0A5J4V1W8_9EUKA|nr:MAG: hypothetical protein EZS28_028010 [Streblomastix strix]
MVVRQDCRGLPSMQFLQFCLVKTQIRAQIRFKPNSIRIFRATADWWLPWLRCVNFIMLTLRTVARQ